MNEKIIDFELQKAKKLFKKYNNPLGKNLVEIGEVEEIDDKLYFKNCTFNMNAEKVNLEDLLF